MAGKTAVLRQFLEFKRKLADAQAELETLRPQVIKFLEKAPGQVLTVDKSLIRLQTRERQCFDQKRAKEELGKVLWPFFETKEYQEVTVIGQKEKE